MITEISKLVSIILAISLASERLVVFLKTLIPWLADKPATDQSVYPKNDTVRRIIVMLIAFLAAWLTSGFLAEAGKPFGFGYIKISDQLFLPCGIMGLLASGGSAFWTNILAYTSAAKDINNQKVVQEKVNTKSQIQAFRNSQQSK